VAGSGKSTVGGMLAERLGWEFADADSFHPPANVEKMRSGQPLTDADRVPWLTAIGAWMDERQVAGKAAVITCSALKRSYRDELLYGRPAVAMVFLMVSKETLIHRLEGRHGHFFPEALEDSQLAALQLPTPDEGRVHVLSAEDSAEAIVAEIIAAISPDGNGVRWTP